MWDKSKTSPIDLMHALSSAEFCATAAVAATAVEPSPGGRAVTKHGNRAEMMTLWAGGDPIFGLWWPRQNM